MAGKTNFQDAARECNRALAMRVDAKYAILENFFKDRKTKEYGAKMAEYEEKAKRLRAGFASGAGGAPSAARSEKELSSFEAEFVKWYEGDEDVDDAQLFSTVISFIRETKERLQVYGAAMNALGAGSKEACLAILSEAFGRMKNAAQKVDGIAQQTNEERLTDVSSTIMRYIDIEHEMRLAEMMAPSGSAGTAVERAVSRMGGTGSRFMDIRSRAFHLKNASLQKAAAELLAASRAYEGALCAAYLFSDLG